MQVHSIHWKLLGIFKKVHLCFCRTHPSAKGNRRKYKNNSPSEALIDQKTLWHSHRFLWPVVAMQLHYSLLQLTRLIGCKMKFTDIVWAVFLRVIVPEFSLDCVGAQKGMSDKWAGETAGQDVIPQLQAQIVPRIQDAVGVRWWRWEKLRKVLVWRKKNIQTLPRKKDHSKVRNKTFTTLFKKFVFSSLFK